MWRLAALTAALSLMVSAGALAGVRGMPPQFPKLAGKWSHAEINVTIKKQPHTLVLDHGRITRVSATQLVLRRFDGTTATIKLDSSTRVTLANLPAQVMALQKGEYAVTMIVDAGAAVRVKGTFSP